MNESVSEFQDGRIQDGCHHQVESEWMSEVFFVQMAESKLVDFKMAAHIQVEWFNEWAEVFIQNDWIQDGSGWIQDG